MKYNTNTNRFILGNWKNQDLEWIVLKETENKLLLQLAYGIHCMPYDADGHSVCWESSNPRSWLYDIFLPNAFSRQDINCLKTITIDHCNHLRNTKPSVYYTSECIFLLSEEEVKTLNPQPSFWIRRPNSEIAKDTEGVWWLRSYGRLEGQSIGVVRPDGVIYPSGDIRADTIMIVPAICVKK